MQVTIKPQHLRAVLTHAAGKDVRYYLKGVLIERATSGTFYLVATDGARMAVGSFHDAECDQVGPWQFIIPLDVCKAVVKGRPLTLTLRSHADGRYELGGVMFTPVDGKFPDWRRACPATQAPTMADVNPELLADAVEFVRVWSGDKKQGRVIQQGTTGAHVTGTGGDCFAIVTGLRRHYESGLDAIPRVVFDR